ncbi:MAG: hypothetical protein KF760_28015 [Candidatus Eremiobacteraeota bacterium]|nr:hypothetical protein [Candidatus Eremiobacteraeota bacterium]
MAEIVVAFAIIAFLTLALVHFFLRLSLGSAKGADQTVAFEYGEHLLDVAVGQSPAQWNTDEVVYALDSHDSSSQTTYYSRLSPLLLNPGDNAMGDLYRLDLEVWWWPQGSGAASTRSGMGRLSLRQHRSVFVENQK